MLPAAVPVVQDPSPPAVWQKPQPKSCAPRCPKGSRPERPASRVRPVGSATMPGGLALAQREPEGGTLGARLRAQVEVGVDRGGRLNVSRMSANQPVC